MRIVDALQNAYEVIKDKGHWTVKNLARTASGDVIPVTNPRADKFCAVGAVHRVTTRPVVPIQAL